MPWHPGNSHPGRSIIIICIAIIIALPAGVIIMDMVTSASDTPTVVQKTSKPSHAQKYVVD